MKSKGQAETQGFIFILAIIVGSLTLLLGYQGIKAIMGNIEQAELTTFHRNLESDISLMSSPTKYGSIKSLELTMPENFDKLCLVDSLQVGNPSQYIRDNYLLIADSLIDNNVEQAFLLGDGFVPYKVGNITLPYSQNPDGILCVIPKAGIIDLKLRGLGRSVEITLNE